MVHVGLDLSRTRLDVHVMDEAGTALAVTTAAPDRGGLAVLADRIGGFGGPVYAAIESMNGARSLHRQLELAGWQVEIADAQKVKGLAPLACKTDKIDAWVLAELSRRDLVPAIWLPTPGACHGRCVSHGWTKIGRCDRHSGREGHPRATERPRVCRDRCGSPAQRCSCSVGDRRVAR